MTAPAIPPARQKIIDFDVLESPPGLKVLEPYIAREWAGYLKQGELIPNNGYTVPMGGTRRDAVRPDG